MLKNLLKLPGASNQELFETLLENGNFKLERIISTGQATPPGEWYDQDRDEWVLLLSGEGALLFEGDLSPVVLRPGDSLLIPAHRRHRVQWTTANPATLWLALHFTAS